jgi:hypothetical protein
MLRWIISFSLIFLLGATPSRSQILGPSDSRGVFLHIQLDWATAIDNGGGPNGIVADIVLKPDQILVTRSGLTPEGANINRGCGDRLRPSVGSDGKPVISPADAEMLVHCWARAAGANATLTHHAVILPLVGGPRKCTETKLTNGLFQICAELLQQSTDHLRMEYEEDKNYAGTFYGNRGRFDVTLQRDPRFHWVVSCSVKLVAAYSFNPKDPSRLIPFSKAGNELCTVGNY